MAMLRNHMWDRSSLQVDTTQRCLIWGLLHKTVLCSTVYTYCIVMDFGVSLVNTWPCRFSLIFAPVALSWNPLHSCWRCMQAWCNWRHWRAWVARANRRFEDSSRCCQRKMTPSRSKRYWWRWDWCSTASTPTTTKVCHSVVLLIVSKSHFYNNVVTSVFLWHCIACR